MTATLTAQEGIWILGTPKYLIQGAEGSKFGLLCDNQGSINMAMQLEHEVSTLT